MAPKSTGKEKDSFAKKTVKINEKVSFRKQVRHTSYLIFFTC